MPAGMVNPGVTLNDHMALVPHAHAHAYFAAADELACDASRHSPGKHVQLGGKFFLAKRLAKLGALTEQLDVAYVLLRAPPGADCWRLKSHATTKSGGATAST